LSDLFKCIFSRSCASVDKASTDRASRGPSATAERRVKFALIIIRLATSLAHKAEMALTTTKLDGCIVCSKVNPIFG